ncbi:excalibur calcium-binding domain-containing protein [Kibdelosporangium philippinense]|uniref:excalibur calcium-binding domain-containing protein n=1 Tax=Kibdelosporangium philippinense TaxID=211113 RepID=UPI003607BC4E
MRLMCAIVMLALMSACAVPNRTIGPAPHIPTIASPIPTAPVVIPEPPITTPKPVAVTSTPADTATSKGTSTTPSMPIPAKSAYKNCSQVIAAGKGPIKRGEPGWADWLDHDGDGVACFPKKR